MRGQKLEIDGANFLRRFSEPRERRARERVVTGATVSESLRRRAAGEGSGEGGQRGLTVLDRALRSEFSTPAELGGLADVFGRVREEGMG